MGKYDFPNYGYQWSGSLDGTSWVWLLRRETKAFISATTALNTRNQFWPQILFRPNYQL